MSARRTLTTRWPRSCNTASSIRRRTYPRSITRVHLFPEPRLNHRVLPYCSSETGPPMTTVLKLDEKHYRSPAPMPAKPLIELRGVTKSYRSAQGMMQALRPLDFEIREQEFVSIVGPSGCGKSTLL